jgi:putative ABC transport system permease protein
LSREFALLVGVSFLIATPVAGYAAHRWLADFAYRTTLSWWLFAAAGLAALALALLTVGFQAARAAMVNPVEALRSE